MPEPPSPLPITPTILTTTTTDSSSSLVAAAVSSLPTMQILSPITTTTNTPRILSSPPLAAAAPLAYQQNNSNSLANPNLVVQTQWVGTQLRQPLDMSIVTSIVDKQRIERIDTLFCSMSDDMPLLTKHKVKLILQSYYSVLYDWDDSVYTLPAFELVKRFNLDFVRDINIAKQGIIFYIWTEVELEKQGIGLHRNKRQRMDTHGSSVD